MIYPQMCQPNMFLTLKKLFYRKCDGYGLHQPPSIIIDAPRQI